MGVRIPGKRCSCGSAFLLLCHLCSGHWKLLLGAAGKRRQKTHAEAFVHEAVDNGIHTSGGVREQVYEGDGGSREKLLRRHLVESTPGVDAEHRRPANKKQDHYHYQHSDDQLLGHQVSGGAIASRPVNFGDAPIGRKLLKGHLFLLLAFLQIAPIAIFEFAAGAGFPFCTGRANAITLSRAHNM